MLYKINLTEDQKSLLEKRLVDYFLLKGYIHKLIAGGILVDVPKENETQFIMDGPKLLNPPRVKIPDGWIKMDILYGKVMEDFHE